MNVFTEVNQRELEEKVKKMYREVALHPEITYHFEMGRALAENLGYSSGLLNKIPRQSIDSFAGVGYHFDLADLKEGESVIDLGSGSGMDAFFAALQVGDRGEVIGVDMTPEQLAKATTLRDQFNFHQVVFHNSYIESLPVLPKSVDVVISNGVINLSPQKSKVFREAARVLKPGGRLAVSDIVTALKLPGNISCNATLWAACIGGAMQKDDYYSLIKNAGLHVVEDKINPYEFLSKGARGATRDYGIQSISLLAIKER
ncbi:MAG: methyltransferase domain-containing protein [Cyclobacteriaceae bacterium]